MFDNWVVSRLVDHTLSFYEKPLIQGGTETPMTFLTNNIIMIQEMNTYEMGYNYKNDTQCFFYCVYDGILYKYTFDVYLETKTVELTQELKKPYEGFDGVYLSSVVTDNYFVVSCADCTVPQVSFFDQNLELVKSYEMGAPTNDTINLAAY